MPLLALQPAWIAAHEEIVSPRLIRKVFRMRRARDVGFAAAGELDLATRAAPRTVDEEHQCATPAAPCSSTSRPVQKRSSAKGALRLCGSSRAMVCAKTQ